MEDSAWEIHDTSLPDSPVDAFRHHLIHLHVALPFSEAEREWMVENIDFQADQYGEIADQLGYEGRIVSEGTYKRVVAYTLVSRWLAWRQGAGEFSDQGPLDQARAALAYIIKNVTPDEPLPQSFTDCGGEWQP